MKNNRAVKNIGEAGIIERARQSHSKRRAPYLEKGIGDDCAVLQTSRDTLLLVTTDTLFEEVHFTAETLSAEDLGWKSLAVNISDIAAMGGTPTAAFLSMAISQDTDVAFVESFFSGFNTLAKKTGIILAGGDTVRSPAAAVITVTLIGNCPKGGVVYRAGAQIGDDIYVTGPLGDAGAGLFLLLSKGPAAHSGYESLIEAHQRPKPRLEVGKALGRKHLANAMIDISDGIAKDLDHICRASHAGALLESRSIPISEPLLRLAAGNNMDPMDWVLNSGEDYELLFTASKNNRKSIAAVTEAILGTPAAMIGIVTKGQGIKIRTPAGEADLPAGGYSHFA
jgi:thiamine-monophosphate kinase